MPGKIPERIWLYRIIHYENLEYVLLNGIYCRNSVKADPGFIAIGDSSLIEHRNAKPLSLEPYGTYADYVAFYFGSLSPMLLRIKTGRGVTKRPQEDIIYLCCRFEQVAKKCNFIFFDGHSNHNFSKAYKEQKDLDKIDWSIINERYWYNTEIDNERERRKQAELIAFQHVPVDCIAGIVVYNEERKVFVEQVSSKCNLDIKAIVKKEFYYH